MASKKNQAEAKRLERLRKDLENQQKQLDQDKAKLRAEKKEISQLRKKYEQTQKEVKAKKNKLDQEQRRLNKSTPRSSPRSTPRQSGGGGSSQMAKELEDAKARLQKKTGDLRAMRKQLEELKQRNKLLERQSKSGARGRSNTNSDKRLRQLQQEISVLKKKIKLLLRDLEKQRRYYQTQLKRFKNQQEKWLARQRETKDKKGIVIKYVFIDDIKVVKRFRNKKGRIKVVTRDGGEVIIRDCDVIDASEVEEAVDDEQDKFMQELEDELRRSGGTKKKGKKKKKKKDGKLSASSGAASGSASGSASSGGDDNEDDNDEDDDGNDDDGDDGDDGDDNDMGDGSALEDDDNDGDGDEKDDYPSTLDELNVASADDVDPEEIPTEANMTDQILALIEELESRTRDLHQINDIYENESKDQQDDALKDLLETVQARHDEWSDKLTQQNFEMKDELPTLNKAWQDEIYKVCTTVAASSQPQKSENKGFSLAPDNSDVENLVKTNKELLTELQGRVGDLKHLNQIYSKAESKDDSDDNENGKSRQEEIDALLGDLDDRHGSVMESINGLTEKNDDADLRTYMPTNNKDWRDEIANSLKSTESSQKEKEAMKNELAQRTKDLSNISKILDGDEALSMFDDIIAENEARHDSMKPKNIKQHSNDPSSIYVNSSGSEEENKESDGGGNVVNDESVHEDMDAWVDTIKLLQKQRQEAVKAKSSDGNGQSDSKEEASGVGKLKGEANEALINEMNDRRKDLLKITELSKLDAIPDEEIDNIIEDVSARHEQQKSKLRSCMKENGLVEDSECQKLLENIENDNKQWLDLFQNNLTNDERTKLNLKKRNEIYMAELEGRITDLIKVKNLADKKEKEESEAELQSTLNALIDSAQERQKQNENEFKETINDVKESDDNKEAQKSKEKDEKLFKEFATNDCDWIDALGNASESVVGLKPQEVKVGTLSSTDVLSTVDATQDSKQDGEDEDDDRWWLDKNEQRVAFIDSIKLNENEDEGKELNKIAGYLDCVLGDSKDDDAITPLYVPVIEKDSHHTLSVLYDGVLLCKLINKIEADFIDPRSINLPDAINPIPLTKAQVAENMQLVMSSLKSLGIDAGDYSVDAWFDSELVGSRMIEMVKQLADHNIRSNVMNPTRHPELLRLAKNNEIQSEEIDNLNGSDWIERWINNTLDRPVKDKIKDEDFNKDLFEVMSKLYPKFKPGCNGSSYDENEDAACEYMVQFAKNNLKLQTNVSADALKSKNRNCQELFASELFDEDSGLAKLNKNELRDFQGFVKKDKHSPEEQTLSWINSMLPPDFKIKNLYRDLSDGIVLLKLLDRAQPGCVDWSKKNVKQPPKTRFDKFQNCNYAMNKVVKKFPFETIVGAKGEDFVNAEQRIHQKQVHSFLWQLMRYHATKQLSQLSFGGKDVTESDIVQWANLKVSEFADRVSTNLSSFKDPQLTTCVFYCELLEAIVPDSINMSIVHTDLPPLKDSGKDDKYMPKRLQNARYAMSMVRRLGGELFVMPEDLVCKEAKAVLSVFAAIMTIDMTGPASSKMTDIEDAALNASKVPV